MDSSTKGRLESLLRQAQLMSPLSPELSASSPLQDVFNTICRLVLDEQRYRELWDEPILSQLSWLLMMIDPYTAFTGDVILDRDHWRIQGINCLAQKLEAARLSGCRRVFIPNENLREVESAVVANLQVIPVEDLLQVFLQLQAPLQPLPSDSLQIRKINALHAHCQSQGWDIAPPRPIQAGVQVRVVPLDLPELAINIYHTGTHTPR